MYKYILNKKENKIIVANEEKNICEAKIYIENDIAKIDCIDMDDCIESHMCFIAWLCNETKSQLIASGTQIRKVLCGSTNRVIEYDELLENIGKNLSNSNTTTIPNRR